MCIRDRNGLKWFLTESWVGLENLHFSQAPRSCWCCWLGSHTWTTCASPLEALTWGAQPVAGGLHEAQDGYECGPTHNRKFIQNLCFDHQFSLVFVYLMCGPRQLFFFQCDPEMPKGWIPLQGWHPDLFHLMDKVDFFLLFLEKLIKPLYI